MAGGGEILSKEGTTQGDPLGMAMFSLSMVPLIARLTKVSKSTLQVWFADDATGVGSFVSLKQWWNCLSTFGPLYGYHLNAAKTSLAVREEQEEEAKRIFEGTGISVTTEGKKHRGQLWGPHHLLKASFHIKWTSGLKKLRR